MWSRRRFLAGMLGGLAGAALPFGALAAPSRFVSARADATGRFLATVFDTEGTILVDLPLPARGHGAALHPTRPEVAVFARRPGAFLYIIDLETRHARHVAAAAGRFFNGHGCFAADRLYTSETLAANGDGLIGVYDARDGYRRLDEFPSHGLDPHDIRRLGDGRLVIANGGILTHPDAPRVKLNLDTMDPSLVQLDAHDGRLLGQWRLPPDWHRLSIRHLAIAHDGTVAVAMQYEGPATERPPLVALLRPGTPALETLPLPEPLLASLRNYCGSAAVDASGRVLGVSSPRGGMSLFWDIEGSRLLGGLRLDDGCGIAAAGDAGGFLLSSGLGGIHHHRAGGDAAVALGHPLFTGSRWDNHLLAL